MGGGGSWTFAARPGIPLTSNQIQRFGTETGLSPTVGTPNRCFLSHLLGYMKGALAIMHSSLKENENKMGHPIQKHLVFLFLMAN